MKFFPIFLVIISAHGFLLDKPQSSSGQSVVSNQVVTVSEFLAETKARHQGDAQLRQYVDKSLGLLTSQLELKFDIIEKKLIRCENQTIPSQEYESLEQKYMNLERKYVDLERKYTQLQSVNKDLSLIKNQLVSVQNRTSEINHDVTILKQLGNIKPLHEIQTLKQAVQTVTAQTHSLSVNERARSQDFIALYNMTIDSKRVLSELNTNTSNRFNNLETKTNKQLFRIEQNHNVTAANIISKVEAIEKQDNLTMSVMKNDINKNTKRVAITAHPSTQGTVSNTIMKFSNVQYSVGITNLLAYQTTGKFTCEQEGLYLISASVLSYTSSAHHFISLNGNYISNTYIDNHVGINDHNGAVSITLKLNPNDQVWLYAGGSWYLYGALYSQFTIMKIK